MYFWVLYYFIWSLSELWNNTDSGSACASKGMIYRYIYAYLRRIRGSGTFCMFMFLGHAVGRYSKGDPQPRRHCGRSQSTWMSRINFLMTLMTLLLLLHLTCFVMTWFAVRFAVAVRLAARICRENLSSTSSFLGYYMDLLDIMAPSIISGTPLTYRRGEDLQGISHDPPWHVDEA